MATHVHVFAAPTSRKSVAVAVGALAHVLNQASSSSRAAVGLHAGSMVKHLRMNARVASRSLHAASKSPNDASDASYEYNASHIERSSETALNPP